MRQRRSLLKHVAYQLTLPARRWKHSLQLVGVCANKSTLLMANTYLLSDLLFFANAEGDEATSPSFAAENTAIHASSALLEAFIAT